MNTESTNGTPNPKPKKSGKKSIKNILKQAAYEAENQEFIRIRGHLKEKLNPMRYEHTLGVSFTCISLAMRYGYDLNKAELAGLLHDCAKRYDESEIIKKCRNKGIELTENELNAPAIIHAKLGAWMAENKYGITDPEILQAIACHTTGKPAMGLLDKILYVADYIEPRRNRAPLLTEMRRLAFTDLDEALYQIMKGILEYLNESGAYIDEMTRIAYEYYDAARAWKRLLLPRLWENLRRKYSSMTQASKMAKIAVKALEDKKGEDIRIIDIRDVSILADYFIIANGNNASQVQAMVDSVEEELLKEGHECRQIEGYNTANWILMDYNDIIVHVFSREDRLFYDLERIWRDGKQIASIDEL